MNTWTVNARNSKHALRRTIASIALLLLIIGGLTAPVYANQPSAPPVQGNEVDWSGCYILGFLVWIGLAVWGIAKIAQKGRFPSFLQGAGCILFILFGWWSLPIILGLGPLWLLIAANVEEYKRCPYCRVMIPVSATTCPNDHKDLPTGWGSGGAVTGSSNAG